MKNRIVILGASGFIGSSIVSQLKRESSEIKTITSKDCDLLDKSSINYLNEQVKDEDIFIFAAARAPAKNWNMFEQNMKMVENLILGLQGKKISYFLNISSDAVYSDSKIEINENSNDIPDNPHGYMHLVRECLINKNLDIPVGHIRPTLVFGENDPHNGYGPNSFLRLAKKQENISLFGKGEELRDHVYVEDVARIALLMVKNKTTFIINAVSSNPLTFMEIAKTIENQSKPKINVITNKRNGPMPHNGLRVFAKSRVTNLSPTFKFLSLKEYIKKELNG